MDNNSSLPTIVSAIVISTIVSIGASYYIDNYNDVQQAGGRENYELQKKMYKSDTYRSNMKGYLESQISGKAPEQDQQAQEEPKTTGTITQDVLEKVKKDAYFQWSSDADILWIEYSDLECPFCKRLHDSKAIPNLQNKYGSKLAVSFKHYPLPFHPLAAPAAQTAECIGKEGGSDKYFAFIEWIFTKGTPTQDIVNTTIKELGLNVEKINKCVSDNTFKSKVDENMTEGSSLFSVNGTPGNVLINNKTGKYEVISGAFPEASFDAAIARLLAE